MKANWKKRGEILGGEWYTWGDVKAIVTKDEGLWHISVSLAYRYPTWEEVKSAWYDLVPGAENIAGAIILPRKRDYVNLHPNCFHVFELNDSEIKESKIQGDLAYADQSSQRGQSPVVGPLSKLG